MKPKSDIVKIIIAGDGGVGKTTLMHKYLHKVFKSDTTMTIGADFLTKNLVIDNRNITFQIFDLAGQSQFRFFLNTYFTNAFGVLYVYDLSRPTTILGVKEWVELNKNNNSRYDRCVQFLVGNKLDLCKNGVDNGILDQFLESNPSYVFHKKYMTSASSGENVEAVFQDLGTLILEERRKYEAKKA